jgi:hypothetical protein
MYRTILVVSMKLKNNTGPCGYVYQYFGETEKINIPQESQPIANVSEHLRVYIALSIKLSKYFEPELLYTITDQLANLMTEFQQQYHPSESTCPA